MNIKSYSRNIVYYGYYLHIRIFFSIFKDTDYSFWIDYLRSSHFAVVLNMLQCFAPVQIC